MAKNQRHLLTRYKVLPEEGVIQAQNYYIDIRHVTVWRNAAGVLVCHVNARDELDAWIKVDKYLREQDQ